MIENSNHAAIAIESRAQIAEETLSMFSKLVRELASLVLPAPSFSYFNSVLIIPDGTVEETVNELYKKSLNANRSYRLGTSEPRGLAIPVETRHTLNPIILFTASFVNSISTAQNNNDIIPTVLEELLHVKVYTAIYKNEGFISLRNRYIHPDLYTVGVMIHDEFYVNREKVTIAQELIKTRLQFDGDINSIISDSFNSLHSIIHAAASGKVPVENSWNRVTHSLHKGLLDPLSRYFAINYTNADSGIKNSFIYSSYIKPHWEQVHAVLQTSHTNNLSGYSDSIKQIVKILTDFLSYIGVDYIKKGNGYWVDFHERFFRSNSFD
ncbi:MAG: hypothetical protein GY754_46100 [bacterium]|nr:hypothetical protein [bacterium]